MRYKRTSNSTVGDMKRSECELLFSPAPNVISELTVSIEPGADPTGYVCGNQSCHMYVDLGCLGEKCKRLWNFGLEKQLKAENGA